MKLDGRRILYASPNHAWGYGWTFYQMLAEALAAENDVVYVDAPTSLVRLGRRGFGLLARARAEPHGPVRVLASATIPVQRSEAQRRVADRLLVRAVTRWSGRNRFAPDLVWAYTPRELELLDRFPRAASIYWTGDEVTMRREGELLARADAILCVSEPVHERHAAAYADRAHFVPVACDFERYHSAVGVAAPELDGLPRPIAGYCGFVNERVDPELLLAVAASPSVGTVVVAGPASVAFAARLAAAAKVVVLGALPAERVPVVMAGFDVALVPYRDTAFNRNSNPVKFYEYLALGLPVVSTDVPTLRRFDSLASVGAETTFVERCEAVLAVGGPGDAAARVDVARDHSFDALLRRLRALPL